jgi:hypothetical protein
MTYCTLYTVRVLLLNCWYHCPVPPFSSFCFFDKGAFGIEANKDPYVETGPNLDRLFLDLQEVSLSNLNEIKKITLPNSHFPAEPYQPNRQTNVLFVREAEKHILQIVLQNMLHNNPDEIPALLVLGSAGVGKVCLSSTLKIQMLTSTLLLLDLGFDVGSHRTYSREENCHFS